jgi:UPF0271 protein
MSKHYFQVERAGVHTTFQDFGRFNVQHLGICPGGSMDSNLLKISNKLVNNPLQEGVLEFAYQGPRLKLISGNAKIAVTGNVHFTIERQNNSSLGEQFNCFETYNLYAGDTLDILATKKSVYGYLSIEGGFQLKKFYNSVSTLTRSGIGPNDGKKIDENIKIFFIKNNVNNNKKIVQWESNFNNNIIRVLEGPQFHYFSKKSINEFFLSKYKITNHSDRMGMRLEGHKLENIVSSNIASEGIMKGAIQITGDGNPIILMADHPTIGGYPKIATVISADFAKVAQLSPGKEITFKKVNIYEAQKIFYNKEKKLSLLFDSI